MEWALEYAQAQSIALQLGSCWRGISLIPTHDSDLLMFTLLVEL
jgi:hypothetical protein